MTELDKTKGVILKYLNEPHVRQNSNLTEKAIRDYFYDIKDTTYYNFAFEELANNKQIDKTSSNNQWQIQPSGIEELNRLQEKIDAIKNNPLAAEIQDEAKTWELKYYKSQITANDGADKKENWRLFIGFLAGLIASYGAVVIDHTLKECPKELEHKVVIDIATHPPMKDTIYVIEKKYSVKKTSKKQPLHQH